MNGDQVSINGRIMAWGDTGLGPGVLLAANFVYQKIHTLGHEPLQVDAHAAIVEMSYKALYGATAGVTPELLKKEVGALLRANRYPTSSNLVTLYVIPTENGPLRMICTERTMVYKGYAYWHKALDCMVLPYEHPFSPHKTAVSLAAHTYAADYARRNGFDAAIAENNAGIVTSLGEDPLFVAVRNDVFTTAIDDGAADSVERRLGIAVCEMAGMTVDEQPVRSDILDKVEEIFTVTPQGIVSVGNCAGKLYPHSLAKALAGYLRKMSGL